MGFDGGANPRTRLSSKTIHGRPSRPPQNNKYPAPHPAEF